MPDTQRSIYDSLQISVLDAPLPALKSTWVAIEGWTGKDYEENKSIISNLRLSAVSLYEYGHSTSEMSDILQAEFAHNFADIEVSIGWPKQESDNLTETSEQIFDLLITVVPL